MTDQAAGLRRRAARLAPRAIQVFSASKDCAPQLAQAFHHRGLTVLLIDAHERLLDASTRNLFGWRRQLERDQLLTHPMPYGDGWRAAGVRADEPALARAVRGYDVVVFDVPVGERALALMPGAVHAAAVEVHAGESLRYAYALVKTLAGSPAVSGIGLFGDRGACERVLAASRNFLTPACSQIVCSVAGENDVFAALAVRMSAEETSLTARHNKGINPNHGW